MDDKGEDDDGALATVGTAKYRDATTGEAAAEGGVARESVKAGFFAEGERSIRGAGEADREGGKGGGDDVGGAGGAPTGGGSGDSLYSLRLLPRLEDLPLKVDRAPLGIAGENGGGETSPWEAGSILLTTTNVP